MIILFITQFVFVLTIIFLLTNHPLALRFILILTRIFYSAFLYVFSLSSWVPYILVIVFLSGIIIIIIYITSLSSNEPISVSKESIFILLLSNLLIFLSSYKYLYTSISNTNLLNRLTSFIRNHSSELIYKTYNYINWEITSMLIIYLFIVLIVAVKVTSLNSGPLRTKK